MIYDQCMQQQLLTFIMTVVGEGDGVDECVRVGVCVYWSPGCVWGR